MKVLYNSRSWRITRPLRQTADLLRSLRRQTQRMQISRWLFSPILACLNRVVSFLRRNPKLYCFISSLCRWPVFNVLPRLYRTLRMREAKASWGNKPFLSSRKRHRERAAWVPGTRELPTCELLQRIRDEIHHQEEQEGPYGS